mgnify:CR=1 FL=1
MYQLVMIVIFYASSVIAGVQTCKCSLEKESKVLRSTQAVSMNDCRVKLNGYVNENLFEQNLCSIQVKSYIKFECNEFDSTKFALPCQDLEESFASRSIDSVSGMSYYISNPRFLEPSIEADPCHLLNTDPSAVEDQVKSDKISLHFKTREELLKAMEGFIPGSALDRSKDQWQFTFHLPNDNAGLGLFGLLFNKDGNDYGNTHGMKLNISKGLEDGYHLTFEYSTNLYTRAVPHPKPGISQGELNELPAKKALSLSGAEFSPGASVSPRIGQNNGTQVSDNKPQSFDPSKYSQLFLEENIAKIILDNRDKVEAGYYKVGVGWHELNDNEVGNLLLSAAKQQQEWHRTLGDDVRQYNYIKGRDSKSGVAVDLSLGRDDTLFKDHNSRITSNIEAGAGLSSANTDANYVEIKSKVNFDYQSGPDSMAYRFGAGVEAKRYKKSNPAHILSLIHI